MNYKAMHPNNMQCDMVERQAIEHPQWWLCVMTKI